MRRSIPAGLPGPEWNIVPGRLPKGMSKWGGRDPTGAEGPPGGKAPPREKDPPKAAEPSWSTPSIGTELRPEGTAGQPPPGPAGWEPGPPTPPGTGMGSPWGRAKAPGKAICPWPEARSATSMLRRERASAARRTEPPWDPPPREPPGPWPVEPAEWTEWTDPPAAARAARVPRWEPPRVAGRAGASLAKREPAWAEPPRRELPRSELPRSDPPRIEPPRMDPPGEEASELEWMSEQKEPRELPSDHSGGLRAAHRCE